MVQRKRFEAPGDYSIAVAAERMKDGQWSAVTTIQQSTQTRSEERRVGKECRL